MILRAGWGPIDLPRSKRTSAVKDVVMEALVLRIMAIPTRNAVAVGSRLRTYGFPPS